MIFEIHKKRQILFMNLFKVDQQNCKQSLDFIDFRKNIFASTLKPIVCSHKFLAKFKQVHRKESTFILIFLLLKFKLNDYSPSSSSKTSTAFCNCSSFPFALESGRRLTIMSGIAGTSSIFSSVAFTNQALKGIRT
jgi:hypothetical protein